MIDSITNANHESGVPIAALCKALCVPRASYYRKNEDKASPATTSRQKPKNALSIDEQDKVLSLLHSERFIDRTPYDAFNVYSDPTRPRIPIVSGH